MSTEERLSWARTASYSAVFAALVLAATMISLATPITKGYFNLGESMVYTAAIIGGPLVGFIAGSVGSSIADIVLGYAHYAPGTFIIKGLEGLIVGYLFARLSKIPAERWSKLLPFLALLLGLSFGVVSFSLYTTLYGGEVVISLWGREYSFTVPSWVWALLAVILALLFYLLGRKGVKLGAALVAMAAGGLEMVLGYFIYEATVIYSLGIGEMSSPLAAGAEIPINIGQALVGMSIAVVVVGTLWRAGASSLEE